MSVAEVVIKLKHVIKIKLRSFKSSEHPAWMGNKDVKLCLKSNEK